MPLLLQPAGSLYGWIVSRRWRRIPRFRASVPVICIGNLTAGGAGKTPLAITVAGLLRGSGETPAFLSRGYGGSVSSPRLVDATTNSAAAVGDEPLLLARHAPTVVSPDRVAGAKAAIAAGASVIVMDDGFQNPSLKKDLAIVAIDGGMGIGNGRVLPAGPLRAPLAVQAEHADAFVIVGDLQPQSDLGDRIRSFGKPVLSAKLTPSGDTGWLMEQPIVAFAGIGRPEKFFATLTSNGATLADQIAFPDHYRWREADAETLLKTAQVHKARLVTTEKDWVRIENRTGPLADLRAASQTLPVDMSFDDPNALAMLIQTALKKIEMDC